MHFDGNSFFHCRPHTNEKEKEDIEWMSEWVQVRAYMWACLCVCAFRWLMTTMMCTQCQLFEVPVMLIVCKVWSFLSLYLSRHLVSYCAPIWTIKNSIAPDWMCYLRNKISREMFELAQWFVFFWFAWKKNKLEMCWKINLTVLHHDCCCFRVATILQTNRETYHTGETILAVKSLAYVKCWDEIEFLQRNILRFSFSFTEFITVKRYSMHGKWLPFC